MAKLAKLRIFLAYFAFTEQSKLTNLRYNYSNNGQNSDPKHSWGYFRENLGPSGEAKLAKLDINF